MEVRFLAAVRFVSHLFGLLALPATEDFSPAWSREASLGGSFYRVDARYESTGDSPCLLAYYGLGLKVDAFPASFSLSPTKLATGDLDRRWK